MSKTPEVFQEWINQQAADDRAAAPEYEISHDYIMPDKETLRDSMCFPTLAATAYAARGLVGGENSSIRVTYKGVVLAFAGQKKPLAWALPGPVKAIAIREELLQERDEAGRGRGVKNEK
jgi:hypothetical protein